MGKTTQKEQTKQEIIDSLITLLEKKSYDDITVGEISKASQISRTTIYRHFENKDSIATEYIKSVFAFSTFKENASFDEILRHRLSALKNSNLNIYLKKSRELREIMFSIKDHSLITPFKDLDQTAFQFISGGIGFSIRNWALSDFKQDVETLADKINSLVQKIIE